MNRLSEVELARIAAALESSPTAAYSAPHDYPHSAPMFQPNPGLERLPGALTGTYRRIRDGSQTPSSDACPRPRSTSSSPPTALAQRSTNSPTSTGSTGPPSPQCSTATTSSATTRGRHGPARLSLTQPACTPTGSRSPRWPPDTASTHRPAPTGSVEPGSLFAPTEDGHHNASDADQLNMGPDRSVEDLGSSLRFGSVR